MTYKVTYKAINRFGDLTHYLRYARDLQEAVSFSYEAARTKGIDVSKVKIEPIRD
jgi:hypothetical protein